MPEELKCNCKEKALKKFREFLFISGSVFVGATLAILLSASLLRPKCPPPPMGMMPPAMQQQFPPAYHHRTFTPHRCNCKCHKKHNGKFNNQFEAKNNPSENFPQESVDKD